MTAGLRRLGLKGREASVTLDGERLIFATVGGATAELPLSRIAKARLGFAESRGGTHLFTRLWLTDDDRTLYLAGGGDRRGYAALAYDLAGALLARGTAVVQTGDTPFVPIVILTTFGGGAIACAALMLWLILNGESWTFVLGPLILFGGLAAFLGPWALARYWPRTITRQDEARRALLSFGPPETPQPQKASASAPIVQ